MDLGATICTPRSPACGICPLIGFCAGRRLGVAAGLPRRARPAARPVRSGIAWVGRREDGLWLIERRPPSGLLGGMLGWPGTEWGASPRDVPPAPAPWRRVGEVRHTFTHFHLELEVLRASALRASTVADGAWYPPDQLDELALPSLMRKVIAHALGTQMR